MSQITNDKEFKQALLGLDPVQQRVMAARFVEHVYELSNDERIARVIKTALRPEASAAELAEALKTAMAVAMDSYTRCGAEGSWHDQSAYFVARAAIAMVTPPEQSKAGGPAWQAAMSSRMARTSMLIDEESGDVSALPENEWQYQLLSEYLAS